LAAVEGSVGLGVGVGVEHAAITTHRPRLLNRLYALRMWLLLLEALGALLIFVFIIWWTMFSGRNKGERQRDDDTP
jgi:hypothetical protein